MVRGLGLGLAAAFAFADAASWLCLDWLLGPLVHETRPFCPYLILGRPDGFLASDLPGPPRSPQPPAGLELRRPPKDRSIPDHSFGALKDPGGPCVFVFSGCGSLLARSKP